MDEDDGGGEGEGVGEGEGEGDSSVNAVEVSHFRIQPDSEDMSLSVCSPPSNSNFPSLQSDSDSGLGSGPDSNVCLIDFFNREVCAVDTDIRLNPNQRLGTASDLNIWGFHKPKEDIDLGLRIGLVSADSGWLGLRVTGIDGVSDQRIHQVALDNGNRESDSVDAMVVDGELPSTSRFSSRDDQEQYIEHQASLVVNNFTHLLEEFGDSIMINHSDIDHDFNNIMINHSDIDHDYNMFMADIDEILEMIGEYGPISGEMFDSDPEIMGTSPASKKVVEDLPVVNLTMEVLNNGSIFCAICKDEIAVEEKVRKLPCSHYYHGNCILPWLEIKNTCPVCRFELPTDDLESERTRS